jgi:hypothetical protein
VVETTWGMVLAGAGIYAFFAALGLIGKLIGLDQEVRKQRPGSNLVKEIKKAKERKDGQV